MISPSWNGPRTHLFDAPVVTTEVANRNSVHYSGPTPRSGLGRCDRSSERHCDNSRSRSHEGFSRNTAQTPVSRTNASNQIIFTRAQPERRLEMLAQRQVLLLKAASQASPQAIALAQLVCDSDRFWRKPDRRPSSSHLHPAGTTIAVRETGQVRGRCFSEGIDKRCLFGDSGLRRGAKRNPHAGLVVTADPGSGVVCRGVPCQSQWPKHWNGAPYSRSLQFARQQPKRWR